MNTRVKFARTARAGERPVSGRPAGRLAALAVSLLILATAGLSAEIMVGIHAGLSMPNFRSNTPQTQGYISRRAPFFGLTADFGVSSHFSICAELNYSSQGGKRNGLQPLTSDQVSGLPLPAGMTLYANFRNETVIDYVEIPLMAKLAWGGRLRFFVQAGPYIGFRTRAVTQTRGTSLLYLDSAGTMPIPDPSTGQPLPAFSFDADTDNKQDIHSTNAGITGGAGVATRLGPGDIILDARFEVGLTNIQTNTARNGENQTGAVVVLLGYSLPFGGRR
jgi:hypothetical protein